jgi:hypothetical protein
MKPLILALLLFFAPQKPVKRDSQLIQLRQEFVNATKEYKESLEKLLSFYEDDVKKAEEKLELSKKLFAERLILKTQVEENERAVAIAKQKLADTNRQIADADKVTADALDDAKFFREYKQAVHERRKAKRPRCSNWTLAASQRTTSNSVSFSYRFVCQN